MALKQLSAGNNRSAAAQERPRNLWQRSVDVVLLGSWVTVYTMLLGIFAAISFVESRVSGAKARQSS